MQRMQGEYATWQSAFSLWNMGSVRAEQGLCTEATDMSMMIKKIGMQRLE